MNPEIFDMISLYNEFELIWAETKANRKRNPKAPNLIETEKVLTMLSDRVKASRKKGFTLSEKNMRIAAALRD